MQFSLKWLLAAATYAAFACMTVAYASVGWASALSLLGFALVAAAAIGACLARGPLRSACVGALLAAAAARVAVLSNWPVFSDVRASAQYAAERIADAVPTRSGRADAYVVQPLDILDVQVAGTPRSDPIGGQYAVGPDGELALGPVYGVVQVSGLTRQETEAAIVQQLSAVLTAPRAQVTVPNAMRAGTPAAAAAQVVLQHLLLLFAWGGAVLGWCCMRRPTSGRQT